ncbi:2Fe-2S iron-sulfur cluster-binding protein [Streptomyces sp. NPDC052682]|uniref:2Fe-2S iron-sulfur cluster-binding protein n=1 Tax=Streptomyces sp. NPDC052682 TaxID=3154954 RepID=UPI0034428FD1
MTDDQHGEGTPQGGGRWDPLPQGDYDDGATAFVKLPEGGVDALLAGGDSPLAAPGHGYVPPQITVTPGTAGTDPAATGTWPVPGAPVDGAQWHDPQAAHQQRHAGQHGGHEQHHYGEHGDPQQHRDPQQHGGHPQHGDQQQHGGHPQHAGHGDHQQHDPAAAQQHAAHDRFTYHPGATGQWTFEDATAPQAPAPGHDVTGQWSIPVADGDLPDESGEFTTSSLVEQWGGTPPATLPGGAPAPWATQAPGEPWGQQAAQQAAGAHATEHEQGLAGPEHAAASYAPEPAAEAGHGHEGYPHEPSPTAGHGPEHPTAPQAPGEPDPDGPDGTPTAPPESYAEPAGAEAAGPEPQVHAEAPHSAQEAAEAPQAAEEAPEAPEGSQPVQGGGEAHEDAEGAAEAAEAPAEPPADPEPAREPEPAPEAAGAPATDAAPDDQVPGEAAETAAPPQDEPPAPSGEEHPLASYVLRVNGADRPVTDAWIGESLLYVLRERLGLAGAKDGCSQGECGACNVQVDGRLVASCLVPAVTAAGSEVRTVEGLAVDGQPSDVQRALARCGAVQCGFCVPGMAMTVHDLLEGNPAPTELETRQALCGNLCRCSGYRGVVQAVKEVVAEREAHTGADAAERADGEARIPHQAGPGAGGVHPEGFPPPGAHDQPYGQDGGHA